MKNISLVIIALTLFLVSCKTSNKKNTDPKNSFVIKTKFGEMKGRLYDETPQHRDNFIKLVNEGFYDSLLFHRVINNFMIQGGDPESKNAKPGVQLGNGGPGYTIPAEFNANLIHKKGALSAARMGDNMNPTKASSGSQFYIVHGTVYDSLQLDQMDARVKDGRLRQALQAYIQTPEGKTFQEKVTALQQTKNEEGLKALWEQTRITLIKQDTTIDKGFTPQQKEIYSTIGGTPHLDGAYTVYGEIYEGLNIIDSIAKVKGDRANRPEKDIVFTIEMIK